MASISIEKEEQQPSIGKEEEKQASFEKEEQQPQQPFIEKEEHQPSIEKEKEEEEEEKQASIEKEEHQPSIEEEEEEEEEEKQESIEKEEHQPQQPSNIEKEEQKPSTEKEEQQQTWEVKSPTAQAIPSSTTHPKPPTEKRSFFSHIYAALFESDNNNNNNSAAKKNDRGFWMNLICGIRPLHHPQLDNNDEEEEPVTPRPIPLLPPQQQRVDSFHDVPLPPPSPGDWSSVDEGMGSRYASAEDLLQVLDAEEQDQDKGVRGSIDVKADEFIARFYEQMRLQRVDSTTDRP